MRFNYLGLGASAHFLRLGDLALIAGANGGGAIISHTRFSNGLVPAASVHLATLLQGDSFIYGVYYHLILGVHYNIAQLNGLNLNHLAFTFGLGHTI